MLEWSAKERRRAACRQLAKPCLIDFRESYESTRYGLRYSSAAGASASPNNLDELISTRSRGSLLATLSCVHWHSTAQHSQTTTFAGLGNQPQPVRLEIALLNYALRIPSQSNGIIRNNLFRNTTYGDNWRNY